MKQGKAWGETRLLFSTSQMQLHRLEVKAGGYCSVHLHEHKWNGFYVERGELLVKVWREGGLLDQTRLGPGDLMQVAPGEKHQFVGLTDCLAFETYWLGPLTEDIVRERVGGVRMSS